MKLLSACAAEECSWADSGMDGAGEQHGHDVEEAAADFGSGFDNDDSYDDAPEHMEPVGDSAEHAHPQWQTGDNDIKGSNAGKLPGVADMGKAVASITMLLADLQPDICDAILIGSHSRCVMNPNAEDSHFQTPCFCAAGAQQAQAGPHRRGEPGQADIRDPYEPLDPHSAGDLPIRPFRKSKPRRWEPCHIPQHARTCSWSDLCVVLETRV